MARSRRPQATQTPSRERKTTTPRRLQATQIPRIRIRRPAHRLELWYKDQILRGMAWEALEQDINKLTRDAYNERHKQQRQRPTWQPITPAPFAPTIVKRREEDQDTQTPPNDTIPEMMREEEGVVGKASSDPVPTLEKKAEERRGGGEAR